MSESYVCPPEDPAPLGGLGVLLAKATLDVSIGCGAFFVNMFIVCALGSGMAVRGERGATRASSLIVLNLAVADMMGGLAQMFYHVTQNSCPMAHWIASRREYCILKSISVVLTGMLSINSLAAIGYDRYLCIVHGLRYHHLMTTRRACSLIAAVWGVSLAGCGALVMHHKWLPPETPCVEAEIIPQAIMLSVGVPMNTGDLLIVAVTHLCIVKEVSRSIAHHRSISVVGEGGSARAGVRRLSTASVKSARVLLLVVGCYMAAFTPVIIVMLLRGWGVGDYRQMEMAFRLCYSLSNMNYIVNPFTYAWKNAPLKADLVALWARLACRGTPRRQREALGSAQDSSVGSSVRVMK